MNAHTTPVNKNQVTIDHSVSLPSTEHWPSPCKIAKLARVYDWIVDFVQALQDAKSRLARLSEDDLNKAKGILGYYEKTIKLVVEKNDALRDDCSPENWFDNENMVRKSELAKLVAPLLGGFPSSNVPDPGMFVRVLLDDLIALGPDRPGFIEVDAAFREVRKKSKFMPSICEIIRAIEQQEEKWWKRYSASQIIGDVHAKLVEAVAVAEREIEARGQISARGKHE